MLVSTEETTTGQRLGINKDTHINVLLSGSVCPSADGSWKKEEVFVVSHVLCGSTSDGIFKLLGSPGIDFKKSIPPSPSRYDNPYSSTVPSPHKLF